MIQALRVRKDLKEYKPRQPHAEQIRWLLVTPQIEDLLRGRTEFGVFPEREAEIVIGRYAAGHLLTVSRQITEERPDIEQVVGADEVWALCFRRPRPGWRLLGRFYQRDIFVALRAWDKHELSGKYDEAAAEVVGDWKTMFGDHPACTGNSISEYMSGVLKDVDETL